MSEVSRTRALIDCTRNHKNELYHPNFYPWAKKEAANLLRDGRHTLTQSEKYQLEKIKNGELDR